MPVVRKGEKKGNLGSYRLVTLSSGTGKHILEAISRHKKNEKATRNSKCRFIEGKSCLPIVPLAMK